MALREIGDPCPELLERIENVILEKNILGIVTRGSWVIYLREHLIIPIFPLKIDAADVYRNLTQLSDRNYRRIGIALYSYGIEHYQVYGEIDRYRFGDMQIWVSHSSSFDELEYVLDSMVETHKVEYILGDVEAVRIAKERAVSSSVITLDYRFMIGAIEQAQYIVQLNEESLNRDKYIHTITNLISEAILSFDDEGKIVAYNTNAMTALQLHQGREYTVEETVGFSAQALLSQSANRLVSIREKQYVVNVITACRQNENIHALIMNNADDIQKIELSIRAQSQEHGLRAKHHFLDIVAVDEKSLQLLDVAKKYAQSQGTILICGETGTGKEMLASSIHNSSPRKDGPFVALNCATLSESLVESELFGYEKGAFTGARSTGKRGLFELAHRGTLFLDEIGDIPINLQAKLLRVLQEREIMRIGGDKVIPVDVRIIAATNRDLYQMIKDGRFREDLFYRLALLELELLPLRERPRDIIPLFLNLLNRHMRKNRLHLFWDGPEVFEPLLDYDWPGNIREPENLAERVVLLSNQLKIDRKLIVHLMSGKRRSGQRDFVSLPVTNDLQKLESEYLHYLLDRFHGDRGALCQYLGVSRPTLWRKLGYQPESETKTPGV